MRNDKMKKFFLILALVIFIGCKELTPVEQAIENQKQLNYVASRYLPEGAKDVQSLGNNWYTFNLEDKRFMVVIYKVESGYSIGITELSRN